MSDDPERRFPIQGGPSVRWSVIAPHQAQCIRNHSQTLERLAERGGLDPIEALSVYRDEYYPIGPDKACIARMREEWAALVARTDAEHDERGMKMIRLKSEFGQLQEEFVKLKAERDAAIARAEKADARVAEMGAQGLTFRDLRAADIERNETSFHCEGWSLCDWMTALAGEVGEAANVIKKVRRGDRTLDDARADLAKELADIQMYLDLLAHYAGIDLGAATTAKFNEVSERIGSKVRLPAAPATPVAGPAFVRLDDPALPDLIARELAVQYGYRRDSDLALVRTFSADADAVIATVIAAIGGGR